MSYEFTKLNEVESVSEMPEGSKIFINDAGTIKQCDAGNIGGGCKIVEFEIQDGDEPFVSNASMTPFEVEDAMGTGVVIGVILMSDGPNVPLGVAMYTNDGPYFSLGEAKIYGSGSNEWGIIF